METNNYFLRHENKRVSIKEEDMFVHKIVLLNIFSNLLLLLQTCYVSHIDNVVAIMTMMFLSRFWKTVIFVCTLYVGSQYFVFEAS